jgi:hypothetical protein
MLQENARRGRPRSTLAAALPPIPGDHRRLDAGTATPDRKGSGAGAIDPFSARAHAPYTPPMCYFCSSTDTMEPFRRQARLPLVSLVIRSLRWRYCRACARHFLTVRRDRFPRRA